jgi:hypothetical protein
MTSAFVLSGGVTAAALAALAILGVLAFQNAGKAGKPGLFWRGTLMLVGAIFAWVLVSRLPTLEQPIDRGAIEMRSAELTARAIAPGSALACLDTVASAAVEDGCEKALFSTPETVAAAVAYVDARYSLLAPSIALADRDPSYGPSLERLRRAIETDRFGLVAHVLTTRGCTVSACPDLRLLRDSSAVLANMKSRAFETRVGVHALAWQPNGATVAAAPATSDGATGAASVRAPSTAARPSKYEFPSADSIPPVSIMAPEPAAPQPVGPKSAEPKPAAPAKRPAHRQSTRDAAPPAPQPSHAAPPLPIAPPAPAAR